MIFTILYPKIWKQFGVNIFCFCSSWLEVQIPTYDQAEDTVIDKQILYFMLTVITLSNAYSF